MSTNAESSSWLPKTNQPIFKDTWKENLARSVVVNEQQNKIYLQNLDEQIGDCVGDHCPDWPEPPTKFAPDWWDWYHEQQLYPTEQEEYEYLYPWDSPYPIYTPEWLAWVLQNWNNFPQNWQQWLLDWIATWSWHIEQGHTYECNSRGQCYWYDAEGNCLNCPKGDPPTPDYDKDDIPGRPEDYWFPWEYGNPNYFIPDMGPNPNDPQAGGGGLG